MKKKNAPKQLPAPASDEVASHCEVIPYTPPAEIKAEQAKVDAPNAPHPFMQFIMQVDFPLSDNADIIGAVNGFAESCNKIADEIARRYGYVPADCADKACKAIKALFSAKVGFTSAIEKEKAETSQMKLDLT